MNLKIGDFGLAAKLETFNEKRKTMCCSSKRNTIDHSLEPCRSSTGALLEPNKSPTFALPRPT